MATKSSAVRDWVAPPSGDRKQELLLYNSLKDEKVLFVPTGGAHSKQISWYTCGPTVYDSAHLGHARNYVTFDILRRVLEDYFGYNILFVMNVTDVDDKIILRARRTYLLKQYTLAAPTPAEVRVLH
jgi:cysteinyl-tRNA synthetase